MLKVNNLYNHHQNLINKSECVCVCLFVCMCMYVFQEKTIYILLPCCITIGYIVTQQLKQVQLFTLLKPLVGNSLNQAWPYVEIAIR
jgi:hypothetical protein